MTITIRRIAGLTLAASLLAVTATACGGDDDGTVAEPTPTASESVEPTPSPTTTSTATTAPATTKTLAVYYLVDSKRGPKLMREFRRLQVRGTDAVAHITSAVDAMLHQAALDPDYTSSWPKATKLLGVSVSGDLATVDLDATATTGTAGSETEELSVQQLVYTATAAVSGSAVKRVQITVNGAVRESMWGHSDTSKPLARANHTDVLAPINVDDPAEGSRVGKNFTARGTSNTFEANVQWRVLKGGSVIRDGFTTATAGTGTRGTFTIEVGLPDSAFSGDGRIRLEVFETSAEDGSVFFTDSKNLTATR